MTISPNTNITSSLQQNSLNKDETKEIQQNLNNQNLKPEPTKEEGQIKSYSTFLGTNIDIRV